MRLTLVALLAACLPAAFALEMPTGATADTLAVAVRAFEAYDVGESRRRYEAVVESADASVEQRVIAQRALANYDWKFQRDRSAAVLHLDQAIRNRPTELSPLYTHRGLIQLEAGSVAEARADAELALAAAATPSEENEAIVLFARCVLAIRGDRMARSSAQSLRLVDARVLLDRVLARQPGRSDASEALMEVGLQLDDGATVLRAFMSYFLFADDASVSATMHQPHAVLRRLAPAWRGKPLTDAQKRELLTALAQARFYHLAAGVARTLRATGPVDRSLLHYDSFLKAVAEVNGQFCPRIALGLRDYQGAYDAALELPSRQLLMALGETPPDERRALFDRLFDVIRARFGAEGYLGQTMNFYGMLAGHAVLEEQRQVTQYGYAGAFRYVAIDRMISRDFTSWYGTTNVGGWGTATSMVQVRQAYLKEPYRRLAWVLDPAERASLLSRIDVLERSDLARCSADRYAEPAALPLRLKLDASDRLHKRLVARGLAGQALALAFVSESLRLSVEATVFAHEGRHALDQVHFKAEFDAMGDDERELRAKYSEIVFTAEPKLALTGSVLGAQLDESSGHGRANKRFRVVLVDWMTAHADQITGLDRTRPLIMQVDLLSDAQLVEMVKAADSMKPK
ncbi:MAG: hypothetical protein ABI433_04210 [Burkholderiaceae bacterium]